MESSNYQSSLPTIQLMSNCHRRFLAHQFDSNDTSESQRDFLPSFKVKPNPQYADLKHTTYRSQEAMENFVFPHEILPNLMKMTTLMNIFLCPIKLCEIAAKLYFFLLTSVCLHNCHFNFSGSNSGYKWCQTRYLKSPGLYI